MPSGKARLRKPVKVPVIMQMEALECGAASLAMVLAHFGKWVPIERVRSDCGVSRDGTNAGQIYRSAESYGLKVRANRYSAQQLREKATFPAIIHWNFNHFLVLRGFRATGPRSTPGRARAKRIVEGVRRGLHRRRPGILPGPGNCAGENAQREPPSRRRG